ncbi:class II D-tagatose-bisphosphate aldolase, non-catalytic subunit [Erysipelothrix urinaevulpis]|uniref:class II D-tagatose-bisphosphate aldolase, non-catalytic subunit n=1 Tax=Erysipelothrix urinaevulpis TaxID=2683717 RepID=UPI00135A8AA7|nr:class II D-tagatose-bisphosphate aldolase, non-catalytic subunit [Erysipelothrix urinaevulpis]
MKKNVLFKLNNKKGVGVYSVCTANGTAIEAALEFARDHDAPVVIESTANQVDQFGGYTGMKPTDFRDYVYDIANKVGISNEMVILGGDHLGPLTWTDKNEDEAMELAKVLVYEYVRAGFTKIHLDTSMRVADDDQNERLSDATIAKRSAILAKEALRGYQDLLKENKDAVFPAFIIGSEVPIPGGAQEEEEELQVTSVEDFETTYGVFKETFAALDVMEVFDAVIGIVVQPGVEFGDAEIDQYNREKAKDLSQTLKTKYPQLVFEGHSTDYQTPEHLREMVEDGINILKVGPALTFAYREALFALSYIEDTLVENPSNFIDVLEQSMMKEPKNWKNHYHGNEKELFIKRKFSYSDRARYYLPQDDVQKAITTLIKNINETGIPMNVLSQHLPYQYRKVQKGLIELEATALIKDYIKLYYEDYHYATQIDKLF